MDYKLDEVIDTLQESATEALKDGGTSEWGHRTLQIVEWLSDYRNFLKGSEDSCEESCKLDDENELKFYYVESIDDYWIGQRLGNFYYAKWDEYLGFVWSTSRYLPWGEDIVNEKTLCKEYTYPSEPMEISFTEWIVGFMKKYSTDSKIECKEKASLEAWDKVKEEMKYFYNVYDSYDEEELTEYELWVVSLSKRHYKHALYIINKHLKEIKK